MRERIDHLLLINQRHTLAQSLQYSLKILAMNNLELQEYIDEKVQKNPFLIKKYNYNNCYNFIEEFPCKESMWDKILKEVSFLQFGDFEKEITEMIFNNIDGNYLSNDLLLYISNEKKIDYLDLLQIIHKLQKTSFATMFAFNLQDKLKIFLENKKLYNDKYKKLVNNIDLVFSQNWSVLKSKYGFQKDELFAIISSFKNAFIPEFSPENDYFSQRIDLLMEEESLEEFNIVIDKSSYTEVDLDHKLYTESIRKCRLEFDRRYIKNSAQKAKLLIKSIYFRKFTLLKIAKEIIYRQLNFFLGKELYLMPIHLEAVADSIFLHRSTVHRAITNKYISTPRGIFSLRSLFSKAIKSNENKISDHLVKEYMKKLIENESPQSPYSDDHIVSILNTKGINISRRTISKYRNNLNIPNAASRTKFYQLHIE
ncbi:MAG: hypothetical protein LBB25_01410 [Holosporaceae bacterium]|jgi:RNA polymerase sigma-54 factor|nr:hypothetical protein [Holosporaceae bacterium]